MKARITFIVATLTTLAGTGVAAIWAVSYAFAPAVNVRWIDGAEPEVYEVEAVGTEGDLSVTYLYGEEEISRWYMRSGCSQVFYHERFPFESFGAPVGPLMTAHLESSHGRLLREFRLPIWFIELPLLAAAAWLL